MRFRLKIVKFRLISDQILREIQTKTDYFEGKECSKQVKVDGSDQNPIRNHFPDFLSKFRPNSD